MKDEDHVGCSRVYGANVGTGVDDISQCYQVSGAAASQDATKRAFKEKHIDDARVFVPLTWVKFPFMNQVYT